MFHATYFVYPAHNIVNFFPSLILVQRSGRKRRGTRGRAVSPLSWSRADGGQGVTRVSQPAGLGRRTPEVAAGAGALRCRPAGQRPGVGGGCVGHVSLRAS